MKVYYYHFRIPQLWFDLLQREGVSNGPPPVQALSIYNRKQQSFINPYEAQFLPSAKGGMTMCIMVENGRRYVGRSWCSLSENFCYRAGREIAHLRAKYDAKHSLQA